MTTARDLAAADTDVLIAYAHAWFDENDRGTEELDFIHALCVRIAALERKAADAQAEMARIIREDGLVVTRVRERAERAEEALRQLVWSLDGIWAVCGVSDSTHPLHVALPRAKALLAAAGADAP
jgi:hypothetical protein